MFESLTLSVDELASRWNITPRQVLDNAQQMRIPLYFPFEGLAIDSNDEWHRFNGDAEQRRELESLSVDIARSEAWIARSAQGKNGQWEQQISGEEVRELRAKIEADKRRCAELRDLLELREAERNKLFFRGLMRAPPKVLWDIQTHGKTAAPRWAFHPHSPVKSVVLAGRGADGALPIWDGRLMALESFPSGAGSPPLTVDSLCAVTAEVKAIEAHFQAPQSLPAKPLPRASVQDAAILAALEKAGHEPLSLPKNPPGKPGVKAEIRAALEGVDPLFQKGGTVFDKAWERLRAQGDIADAD